MERSIKEISQAVDKDFEKLFNFFLFYLEAEYGIVITPKMLKDGKANLEEWNE